MDSNIILESNYERDFDINYETGFINGVQFGVYSPEIILKKSVVHIDVETLYDSNGEPKINGLFDPRMGYIEPRKKCKTCEQTYINCPGHFGHIELPKPVFNLQFKDYFVKILRCICIKCSRLLINKNHQIFKNIIANTKGNYKDRFEKIVKHCKNVKICGAVDKSDDLRYDNGGCGAIQPNKYNSSKLLSDYIISAEWKYDNGDNPVNLSQDINSDIILALFKRITADDALVMGFNDKWCLPHWLIITALPVVPPSVRPSVRQYNSQRSEDDLTSSYFQIIKWCKMLENELNKTINMSHDRIKTYNDIIQHNVTTLFNNEPNKYGQQSLTRGGRVMKTLRQRLSGKEGRIRNNLMGKRVDFSARSVISPDANLSIEELGVPYKIAMNLTFPEVVNKFNINRLYQLVRNGNKIYPGAKTIKYAKNGKEHMISDDKDNSKIILNYGDTINRHLINGDIVLFNRQPSLHKMSMMAHKVRVMEGSTFRLNVDVCKPYNADFDGDEMNMHVPQSLQTAVELRYLAAVSKMIISPSDNVPIIGPAQDNLLGLFKITDENVFFSQQEVMNLLVGVEKFSGTIPEPIFNNGKHMKWTGKQIYSIILPRISYYQKSSNNLLKDIIIEEGILKQGQINKGGSAAILHQIYNDYGHREATRYLNDLQRIITRYIIRSGFSVGISDLIIPREILQTYEEAILQGKKENIELTKKVHLNILADFTEDLDILYNTKIDVINTKTEKKIIDSMMKDLPMTNRINYIISSGSKGAEINIQQMMCLVGAQTIDGRKQVPMGFSDRTLPHYPRYENSSESRGFITSNFLNGLNPQEFFFHAMSGREGVIDTAVKTASSGYLQRKLVKAMEDLKVVHDLSVRNSNNDIVQFCYGYDGFDSVSLEILKDIDFINIDIVKLNKNYFIDITDNFEYIQKSEIDKMKKISNWKTIISDFNKYIDKLVEDFHTLYSKFYKSNVITIYHPVNFKRLILNTSNHFKLGDINKSDLHPLEIIKEIQDLIKFCTINSQRNISCEVLLWNYLSPKILLRDKKFNRIAFTHMINFIKSRYTLSLAEGGEMVGPLAAQSLGEKTTQMTLNSVDWETEIIIAKNGELLIPKIGEFIDDYYNACLLDPLRKNKIQYIGEGGKQIYIPLDDGNDWKAYSCDDNGKVMWTKLEAITRHPVVNIDGTDTILEVELECGRTVKATKGKSFLVYDETTNTIIDKNGSDLQEGDLIPVCEGLELNDTFNIITHLDVKKYLLPTEYIYKDEVNKALSIMNEGTDGRWFNNNYGTAFNVPYNRIDSFKEAFCGSARRTSILERIKDGCVYPKSTRSCTSNIPSMIELNTEFGYFVGAYLADGMANELRIIISKHDEDYITPIKTLMTSWDIGYRCVTTIKKESNIETGQNEWKSIDHIFQSTLLAELISKVFGKTSNDKVIPVWCLQAPRPFLIGLINGYFSGDGHVSFCGSITVASISKSMLEMIGLILNIFNISWTIHKTKQNREKFPNAKEYIYNLSIPKQYNTRFSDYFNLTIKHKQERINQYQEQPRSTKKYNTLNNVSMRKVININNVIPTDKLYKDINGETLSCKWVYDLTVAETRNFTNKSLQNLSDTFHLAGVGEKSAVTAGVPRFTDLLNNKKSPKYNRISVYLDEKHRYVKEYAEKVCNNIELTLIGDVLESSAIYLEPNNDYDNVLPEDREFLEIYRVFSELDPQSVHIPNNPWVIRLEFDRRKIIDKKITMEDINLVLKEHYPSASLMFMDDNAAKLVFRLRINFQANNNNANDDIIYMEEKIKEISNVVIKGIEGIRGVYMQRDEDKMEKIIIKENGSYIDKKEYTLDVTGNNLFDILCCNGVDTTRTQSADQNEMYSIFGIESARFQIRFQLNTVLIQTKVHMCPRHLDLLCDKMCQHGEIMSINCHGIKKENIGPLAKASFEETTEQLLVASLFGAFDNIKGVSSNIMVGQIPVCGTGDSTLLIDEDLLQTQLDIIPEETESHNIDQYFKSSDYCDAGEIKFSLNDINTQNNDDNIYNNYIDINVE